MVEAGLWHWSSLSHSLNSWKWDADEPLTNLLHVSEEVVRSLSMGMYSTPWTLTLPSSKPQLKIQSPELAPQADSRLPSL